MFTLTHPDGHQLSTDPGRIDRDRVHHWLSTDAYRALGRDREAVRDHLASFGVRRIGLATLDAHGVYPKLGFTPVPPQRWMEGVSER
ncbi:hypothetical protein [Micromonospora rifamycinica]|uniref:hypothetical protein n=1 Tax=Micromonospora rifamycinica TaxID=291594 RepID=UPI0009FCDE0B|nr:hypothetical protein [Micromonospora rifamycinica]